MASKVLSQALVTVSGATFVSSSKQLGVSTTVFSAHLCSFKSNRIALSRIASSGFGSAIVPVSAQRSLFVRAESNSDGEVANSEDVVVLEEETEAEVEDGERSASPRKPRVKLGEIMGILNKRAIEAAEKERATPDIRTGDVVEIKLEVPENRRRVSVYKGIVMSKQNAGIHTTIRIRRIIAGIGVEIVFPVYSPNIKEIKVVSHRKVRRARLYYLRDKLPKFSTFK